jgi:hypothetical protein
VSDKPLPTAGQVLDHRAHLLSQRVASKAELPPKTEKQTVNSKQIWTVEGWGGTLNLPQKKKAGKEITPSTELSVNKPSDKPPPKQGR